MALQPFQERVLEEAEDLKGKIDRLEAFIVSAAFLSLSTPDQVLMRQQFTHMAGYLACLEQRIERFSATEQPADTGSTESPAVSGAPVL